MKRLYKKLIALVGILAPSLAFAETTFKSAVGSVVQVSQSIMPVLFSGALAWFIWGVVQFMRSADNSEERKKGKQRIMWGIIALFAMVAYFGLTAVLTNSLFDKGPFLPQLCSPSTSSC